MPLRSTVCCAKCENSSCRACFQTYLLNSPLNAFCMHCKEPHSDDFINENTGTTWRLSTYKTYKEQVMFDAEKARLPESQQYAAAVKEARKLIVDLKRNHKDLIEALRTKRRTLKNGETYEQEADAIRDNQQSINECVWIDRSLGRYTANATATATAPAKRASFIKACPADSCRGFLGEDYVCGLCSTAFCSECHELLGAEHTCNADTVASVKALAKESKPCPTCAAVISKIDGCDQMWCTQCQTTFSWRTGLKEEGRIHNPHYYQWMRLNGGLPREPGDGAAAGAAGCGMPAIHLLINLFSSHDRYIHNIKSKRWENWIRVQHMLRNGFTLQQAVDHYNRYGAAQMEVNDVRQAPTFVWEPTQGWEFVANAMAIHRALGHRGRDARAAAAAVPDNHDLRVKLLLSDISEDAMKVTVQRRAKQWQKDRAVDQVNEMVNQTSADLFRAYFNELTACAASTWEYLIDPDTKQTYWRSLSKERWSGEGTPPKENWAKSIHPPIHKKFNTEITALIKYANSCYQRIESTYKNKIERIVPNY